MISFSVRGNPATQGNKTAFAARRKDAQGAWEYTGKVGMREGRDKAAEEKHRAWREAVKQAAMDAMHVPGCYPLHGPLVVSMIFSLHRPKNQFRTGKFSHLLKDTAPPYPESRPDVIKLARTVEDAMKDAGLYDDDAQIVCYRPLMKLYVGHWAALDFPGVSVKIKHMRQQQPGVIYLPELERDAAATVM